MWLYCNAIFFSLSKLFDIHLFIMVRRLTRSISCSHLVMLFLSMFSYVMRTTRPNSNCVLVQRHRGNKNMGFIDFGPHPLFAPGATLLTALYLHNMRVSEASSLPHEGFVGSSAPELSRARGAGSSFRLLYWLDSGSSGMFASAGASNQTRMN